MLFRPTWPIWYATLLHWTWGIALLSSQAPLGVTAIATMTQLGIASASSIGFLYLLLAGTALLSVGAPRPAARLMVLPQHIAVAVSAWGALRAMITGTFADGVVRSPAFLIADQAPALLLMFFYTGSVYYTFYHPRNPTINPLERATAAAMEQLVQPLVTPKTP